VIYERKLIKEEDAGAKILMSIKSKNGKRRRGCGSTRTNLSVLSQVEKPRM
jgi:hypothetical protein